MNQEKMIRKQIYLESKQNEEIKRLSLGMGKPEAEIVREAINLYLISQSVHAEDPLTQLIGMVNADEPDGSILHDQHIQVSDQRNPSDED